MAEGMVASGCINVASRRCPAWLHFATWHPIRGMDMYIFIYFILFIYLSHTSRIFIIYLFHISHIPRHGTLIQIQNLDLGVEPWSEIKPLIQIWNCDSDLKLNLISLYPSKFVFVYMDMYIFIYFILIPNVFYFHDFVFIIFITFAFYFYFWTLGFAYNILHMFFSFLLFCFVLFCGTFTCMHFPKLKIPHVFSSHPLDI
jgi:hypothetical protein